jgi:hypothetical protein
MLPRWLTAVPRLARTYRDEILVVALGLVYQAGMSGAFDGYERGLHERPVVVRIAAEPVRVERTHEVFHVHAVPTRVEVRHAPAAPIGPRAPEAPAAPAAPSIPVRRMMPGTAPMSPMKHGTRVHVETRGRAARPTVTVEAGENIAAAIEAGDSAVLLDAEARQALANVRAAIDEARVRAALQRALAAEQLRGRAWLEAPERL